MLPEGAMPTYADLMSGVVGAQWAGAGLPAPTTGVGWYTRGTALTRGRARLDQQYFFRSRR